jgi:hypothetical protein
MKNNEGLTRVEKSPNLLSSPLRIIAKDGLTLSPKLEGKDNLSVMPIRRQIRSLSGYLLTNESTVVRKSVKKASFIAPPKVETQSLFIEEEKNIKLDRKMSSSSSSSSDSSTDFMNKGEGGKEKDIAEIVEALLPKRSSMLKNEALAGFKDIPSQFYIELAEVNDFEKIHIDLDLYPDSIGYYSIRRPIKYFTV